VALYRGRLRAPRPRRDEENLSPTETGEATSRRFRLRA
jgi:hypothetical protein